MSLSMGPNILADLLHWHLSFCRIGDRKEKNLVGAVPLSSTAVLRRWPMLGFSLCPKVRFHKAPPVKTRDTDT